VFSSVTGDGAVRPFMAFSGAHALNLGGGGSTATTVTFDAAGCTSIEWSFAAKRGPDKPESGDDLKLPSKPSCDSRDRRAYSIVGALAVVGTLCTLCSVPVRAAVQTVVTLAPVPGLGGSVTAGQQLLVELRVVDTVTGAPAPTGYRAHRRGWCPATTKRPGPDRSRSGRPLSARGAGRTPPGPWPAPITRAASRACPSSTWTRPVRS
jgi:hypothetical protein